MRSGVGQRTKPAKRKPGEDLLEMFYFLLMGETEKQDPKVRFKMWLGRCQSCIIRPFPPGPLAKIKLGPLKQGAAKRCYPVDIFTLPFFSQIYMYNLAEFRDLLNSFLRLNQKIFKQGHYVALFLA